MVHFLYFTWITLSLLQSPTTLCVLIAFLIFSKDAELLSDIAVCFRFGIFCVHHNEAVHQYIYQIIHAIMLSRCIGMQVKKESRKILHMTDN